MKRLGIFVALALFASPVLSDDKQNMTDICFQNISTENVWMKCAFHVVEMCVQKTEYSRIEIAQCWNKSYSELSNSLNDLVQKARSDKIRLYLESARKNISIHQEIICGWGEIVFGKGTDAVDEPGKCRWRILAENIFEMSNAYTIYIENN